ncbi:MAG TPA: hypothetical protein ENJ32_09850, partial [Crenotrichaceae bacterium]|nr:hypothetical protein [Crenotrichaceae bacterium]
GFAWYTRTFPTYQTVYGTLATIPIFLVWLYLSWLVTLLGAQLTYTMGRYSKGWLQQKNSDQHTQLIPTLHVLKSLWLAQQTGKSLSLEAISEQTGITVATTGLILEQLYNEKIVARDENNHWLLTRDLDDLSLWDLYRLNHWTWVNDENSDDALILELRPYLFSVAEGLQKQLSISLAELFNNCDDEKPMLLA